MHSKNKTYEIRTIQDIFNTVNSENIDRFMLDFYKTFHQLSEVKDDMDTDNIVFDLFTWIDDGENNITYDINAKI